MNKTPIIKLNNGIGMPQLGLGVWKVQDGNEAVSSVEYALKVGYRLIDTAALYGNERSVGEAIRSSGIPREDIFITTKLWNSDQGYDSTLKAFQASLDRLGLGYVDLYLIHWPNHDTDLIADTWRAFEDIYRGKRARSIGVSNFKPSHLESLLQTAKTIPSINQIELHPYNSQLKTREFCREHGIAVESWSPLMQGGEILNEAIIVDIAKQHHKTPAQIVLRWHIDNNLVVIPKSVTPKRIKENFELFDFKLSPDEIKKIDDLNQDRRVGPDPDSFGIRVYSSLSKTFGTIKRKNQGR